MKPRRVFISAGEVSGDIAGGRLITEMRRRDPDVVILAHTNTIGVVGVTESLKTLPAVVRAWREIARAVAREHPDVAVLIGNDVFNVLLARWLRRRGVATVSLFPPQIWVWRSLARPIARSFDAIAASFADEYAVYARAAKHATEVRFVGHYLANELRPVTPDERARSRHRCGVAHGTRVVGLFPGSRGDEIDALTPVLLDAALRLRADNPSLVFLLAAADAAATTTITSALRRHPLAHAASVCRDSRDVLRSADLVITASGTASLEAALLGVPMVVVYKVSAITHLVVRAAIRLGLIASYTVGLPNLVLGRPVVPEILQRHATSVNVAAVASEILRDSQRCDDLRQQLAQVADLVRGRDALGDAADLVFTWADKNRARRLQQRTEWATA